MGEKLLSNQHETGGNILIVDDTPANLSVLSMMLTKAGYKVRPAISGEVALKAVEADLPDLILLDIRMPEMDGFEVCQQLKANPQTQDIPVIFISALSEIDDKLTAFDVGGVDYITKPFQTAEVRVRVNTHITIARQRQEIQQLNQLKDQLIDTVTHNLKTPISMVMFYSDMLRAGKYNDLTETAQNIYNAGKRMDALIGAFLDLNRIESGLSIAKRKIALDTLLQSLADDFLFHAERKDITLTLQVDEVLLDTDPDYLGEAINNLISNAIKYTPDGGTVAVRLNAYDNYVAITVEDNGIGIPEAYMGEVFQRFFRVPQDNHAQEAGTGLGLAITAAIIAQLGGDIRVESTDNQGSRFIVELPNE